jgi:RNA-directed DNA polymerase
VSTAYLRLAGCRRNLPGEVLERAREVTRRGQWTNIEYVRFADDLVVMVDSHPQNAWLLEALHERLREEFDRLQVEVNEEKSGSVDLERGESFGFLGFDFWRVRTRKGRWMPLVMPQMKKRTELLRKLKRVLRTAWSQPLQRVIAKINPILRGWVNYFAVGNSSRCFSFVRMWVEKKVRRLLAKARQRRGFGWKRWSRQWLYEGLGLFDRYEVRRLPPPAASPMR